MKLSKSQKVVEKVFSLADVKIGKTNSCDIKVNDERFYRRVLSQGSLGLGESYMDGWWDSDNLDNLFYKILIAELDKKIKPSFSEILEYSKAKVFNRQNKKRAFEVGEKHYDAGNDLYKIMLDKRMVYTCGYWKNAKTLDEAQEAKLDLVCKKIGLKPGMKILDIGCGWGSFAKFAAEKYKVKVVGITISKEQVKLAKKLCKGLSVEIRFQDYRDLNEKFDRVISLGMFEHVGPKNYREYMKMAYNCLNDDGLFLLHTIGNDNASSSFDPWIERYIFPNGMIPSSHKVMKSTKGLFVLEDWHNFGADYDETLMEWNKNFQKNWNKISKNYDEKFKRMWEYYLLCCAGSFRSRKNQLWQIVFSKNGVLGGYKNVR